VIAQSQREGLQSIPWFEGVYEVLSRTPRHNWPTRQLGDPTPQLVDIANQLRAAMNNSANALQILPEATDKDNNADIPKHNWNQLDELPDANAPIPDPPVGNWYVCEHYATAAIDCACIGRLTDSGDLEQLATGNLNWILGINPGIPSSKTVAEDSGLITRHCQLVRDRTSPALSCLRGKRADVAVAHAAPAIC
jgi:hypothetical protein